MRRTHINLLRRGMVGLMSAALVALALPAAPASAASPSTAPFANDIDYVVKSLHSVTLHWFADNDFARNGAATQDDAGWDIRMAPGTQPPADDATPIASLGPNASSYTVTGLIPRAPYTFRIDAREPGGDAAGIAFTLETAATGSRVLAHGRHGWAATTVPETAGKDTAADATTAAARTYVTYVVGSRLLFATYRHGSWSHPRVLSRQVVPVDSEPQIFVRRAPDGTLLVAWQSTEEVYHFRVRHPGSSWSPAHHLATDADIGGIALDGADHIHAIVFEDPSNASYYLTNATGRWTDRKLSLGPGRSLYPYGGGVAYDHATKRIVVGFLVDRFVKKVHSQALRVANAGPKSTRLRHTKTAASIDYQDGDTVTKPDEITQMSLTARAGRFSVGLTETNQVHTLYGAHDDVAKLVVLSGTSTNAFERTTIVTRSKRGEENLFLSSPSGHSLVATWDDPSPSFTRAREGVFTATADLSPSANKWRFSGAKHVGHAHYAQLVSAANAVDPTIVTTTPKLVGVL